MPKPETRNPAPDPLTTSPSPNPSQNRALIAAAGAVFHVVEAMSRFPWAIPLLEISTTALRNLFAAENACLRAAAAEAATRAVSATMIRHTANEKIQESGSAALWNIAASFGPTRLQMESMVKDGLSAATNALSQHPHNISVAKYALGTLWFVTLDRRHQQRAVGAGCVELVVGCLREFRESALVVERGTHSQTSATSATSACCAFA